MPIDTNATDPTTLARASGQTYPYAYYEDLVSNVYRLMGADGNSKTGKYSVGSGSTTSYSNAMNTGGLTVNQGSADDELFSGKSTDVAHGMTGQAEANTYVRLAKLHPSAGGVVVKGLSSGGAGVQVEGNVETGDTTKSTAASAPTRFTAAKRSGTGITGMGANENLAIIENSGVGAKFIFDADGDSHQDVGTSWTNFSDHDDVGVLNLLSAHVSRPNDPLRERFRSFLEERREQLEELRLVTFNADGHHFVNMSRLMMLLVGAAIQTERRVAFLEEKSAGMLPAPPG